MTLADEAFPTNGITISASSTQAFCIAEKPDGTARLKLAGTPFPPALPPDIAARVRWFVTNAAVQNATGTLNSTVCVLTPDMTAKYARVYTVYAGFDCDNDGL